MGRPMPVPAPSRQPLNRFRSWVAQVLILGLVAAVILICPARAQASSTAEARGAKLFQQHCAGCHVHGGNVVRRGKTLKLAALNRAGLASPEAIARVANSGIGRMGGYGQVLGGDGAELVGAWVWQQAQQGWP